MEFYVDSKLFLLEAGLGKYELGIELETVRNNALLVVLSVTYTDY